MVTFNVLLENKTVLVTGAAGFIGANLVKRLCQDIPGIKVVGIDIATKITDLDYVRCVSNLVLLMAFFEKREFGQPQHI